ncbi:MAG TPA: cellulase family glycosylhydrolase [Tepidisphaeraceae bacterium]|nr:cellulase family glycosylhydrolase [Tepidisphaeraceae bacterium]
MKGNNSTPAELDKIAALGFKYVRRGFIWESIERNKGVYDFSNVDQFMKDCDARGLSVIGCMAFSNKLYGKVTTDAGREGYAKFAAALAAHFKGQNILWEIWNEPNVKTFWGAQSTGTHNSEQYAGEYVALVRATVPAMKAANAHCFVLGGAVSGLWSESFKWQQFCFKKGVLKTGIDAWSVHPYSSKSPEDVIESYQTVRKMMVASGGSVDFPIINSERGYPLGKAEGYAGGDIALSKQYQAWHFVRQQLVDMLSGVRLTSWYEWSGKEGFSLYQPGTPLPIYNACKVMMEQLDGYRIDKRLPTSRDRDFVLRMVNEKTGGIKLVAWSAPPPEGTPDAAPKHSIDIPVTAGGVLRDCDIYGQQTAVHANGGKISLDISGAPQYVTLVPGKGVAADALPISPPPPAQAANQTAPPPSTQPSAAGTTDLKLFTKDAQWDFLKNTGDGSFDVATEGNLPIGVLNYDFSHSKTKSTPYVLASTTVNIPDTAGEFLLDARASRPMHITLRLVDSTGQTLQFKGNLKGTGAWGTLTIPLARRFEHWGGIRIHLQS